MKAKLNTMKRHYFFQKLEQMAGIDKFREKLNEGPFGYTKTYKINERIKKLSLPKTIKNSYGYEHPDFRGLLCADYQDIIQKVYKSDKFQRKKSSNSLDHQAVEDAIMDIQHFESVNFVNEFKNSL